MSDYAAPKKNEEAPVTRQGNFGGDTITSHPAFAMIGASRVSGHTNLFGSDFYHQHYMTIRIKRGEVHRGLNRDWFGGREEYIEVALTEAQWATFVSAPNIGDGTPCTLQHRNGERIPGIPSFDRSSQVKGEVTADFAEALSGIDEALAAVDALGLSAKKASLVRDKIVRARRILDDHIPFAEKQFAEHVENTIEKGKQEIHGYMMNVIQRAGITALGGPLPLALEDDTEDGDA